MNLLNLWNNKMWNFSYLTSDCCAYIEGMHADTDAGVLWCVGVCHLTHTHTHIDIHRNTNTHTQGHKSYRV